MTTYGASSATCAGGAISTVRADATEGWWVHFWVQWVQVVREIKRVTSYARSRIRTCMALRPGDFKSPASTGFATRALISAS